MKLKHHEPWEPFVRANPRLDRVDKTTQSLYASDPPDEVWLNNLYQVSVFRKVPTGPGWPAALVHLSIKRTDKSAYHDWRHLQRIKNELVGSENEGVEVFPAESRLVDASNQYHLFVFADPKVRLPFGFANRWVSNVTEGNAVQRPFPLDYMPRDCKTLSQVKMESSAAKISAPPVAPLPAKHPCIDVETNLLEGAFYSLTRTGDPRSFNVQLVENLSTDDEHRFKFKILLTGEEVVVHTTKNSDIEQPSWKVSDLNED